MMIEKSTKTKPLLFKMFFGYIGAVSLMISIYSRSGEEVFCSTRRKIESCRFVPECFQFKQRSDQKMATTWQSYYLLLLFLNIIYSVGTQEQVIPTAVNDDNKPWYESLPAVAMDYKVHIDAGKEDCYYQYVQAGSTLYVSFQVRIQRLVPISVWT